MSALHLKKIFITILAIPAILGLAGCGEEVNNERIPALPVDINLANPGLWSTYGVSGVNTYQYFIKDRGIPRGFYYIDKSFTGFGGVVLCGISNNVAMPGVDPSWAYRPVAYDLACPVEVEADIIVTVDDMTMEAVCPVCKSRYSLEAGGAPVSGPALNEKYGLQQYRCVGSPGTGFQIVR